MISKCENIVINRTKFSEFEIYDPTVENVENLNVVGYIDEDGVKKNVALSYNQIINSLTTPEGTEPGLFFTPTDLFDETNKVAHFGQIPCGEEKYALYIGNTAASLIQIDGITSDCGLNDDTLIIYFDDKNHEIPFGKELFLVLSNLAPNVTVKNLHDATYGEFAVDLIIKYVKTAEIYTKGTAKMKPVAMWIGREGVYYPYATYAHWISKLEGVDARHTDIMKLASASMQYVDEAIATVNDGVDAAYDELMANTKAYTDAEVERVVNEQTVINEDVNARLDELADVDPLILHVKKYNSMEHLMEDIELNQMTPTELSRLIALVSQDPTDPNAAYAEYICINPDKEGETKQFHILGDSDSVKATDTTVGTQGSVVLVGNINEDTILNYGTLNEISGKYIANPGYALSPVALADIYKKHTATVETTATFAEEITERVNGIAEDMDKVLGELEIDDSETEQIQSRLDTIDDLVNTVNEHADKEIDYLKNVIGLNGCHAEGCHCTHDCADIDDRCTILCRLAEAEADINTISTAAVEADATAKQVKEEVVVVDKRVTIMEQIVDTITRAIDENTAELTAKIDANTAQITLGDETNIQAIAEAMTAIGEVAESVTTINGAVNTLNEGLRTANANIAANGTALANTMLAVTAQEATLNGINTSITSIIADHATLNGKYADLSTKVGGFDGRIVAAETAIAEVNGLRNDVATANTAITKNATDITALQGVVDANKADIEAKVTAVETTVGAATAAAETATTAADAATAAVGTMTTTVGNHTTQIEGLTQTLAAVDPKFAAQEVVNEELRNEIAEIKAVEKVTQPAYNVTLDYADVTDGIVTVNLHEICEKISVDSVPYNFNITEVRIADGDTWSVMHPTVTYQGEIDTVNGDHRSATVTTGVLNAHTVIIVSIYIKNNFVFEF